MKTFKRSAISVERWLVAAALAAASLVAVSQAPDPGRPRTYGGSSLYSYPFALGAATGMDSIAARTGRSGGSPWSGITATLFSGETGVVSAADGSRAGLLMPNSFFAGLLGPGTYLLDVGGAADGLSALDGEGELLRTVAPDESLGDLKIWAAMLVGLVLICLRLRQRSRSAGAHNFS